MIRNNFYIGAGIIALLAIAALAAFAYMRPAAKPGHTWTLIENPTLGVRLEYPSDVLVPGEGADPVAVRDALRLRGVGEVAKVQTYEDAQPKFLKDIITTFNMLGAAFSSIGLVVASITIFIVVFINALTRRKFIGILKGIGIHGRAIEVSYVFQSIFYALVGSGFGLLLVYGFLVPFVAAHPIDFPFSDGILVAPPGETMGRVALLVVSTIVAGYIPAWMIIRKNTLDSILGRN